MANPNDIFTCKVVDELKMLAHSQRENQQFEVLQYSFQRQTGPLHWRSEGRDENVSRNDASTTYRMIMSFNIGLYSIDFGLPVSFPTLNFIRLVCKSIWSASQLSGKVERKTFSVCRGRPLRDTCCGLLRDLVDYRSRAKGGALVRYLQTSISDGARHEDCTSFSYYRCQLETCK